MISVEPKGIKEVIIHLNKIKKSILPKKKLFLERLAERGIELEESKLANAQYDGSHESKVGAYWLDDDKMVIALAGEKVTFIEFGTGTYYTDEHEKADELGMIRGEFGYKRGANPPWEFESSSKTNRTEKSRIVREGSWGVRIETYGNPPNRIAYNTGKELREIILEVAKEVFSE